MRKASPKLKADKKLQKALDNFPKIIKEQERNHKAREKDIARFAKLSRELVLIQSRKSLHPWRLCPYGEHWVRTHPLHTKPSKFHPNGSVTTRFNHCARNRSQKDHLYPEEITEIAKQNFSKVTHKPCTLNLGFAKGNDYDSLIAGWVQYWNEVLEPNEALDPNLVKALIASESSFDATALFDPKDSNSARGLTQINNQARKILGDPKGELKDHFINVTKTDLNDPNLNICCGIRWLFNKKKLASSKLGHSASWLEAVSEYKGLSTVSAKKAQSFLHKFTEKYDTLSKCKKS